MTVALSDMNITRKYGVITSITTTPMLDPRSSCRLTSEPATPHMAASSTNPNTRNGTNQPSAGATMASSSWCPPSRGAATPPQAPQQHDPHHQDRHEPAERGGHDGQQLLVPAQPQRHRRRHRQH